MSDSTSLCLGGSEQTTVFQYFNFSSFKNGEPVNQLSFSLKNKLKKCNKKSHFTEPKNNQ